MLNPFTLADSIRYSDDKKLKDVTIDHTSSQLTLSWISTSGLKVSEHLTPELYGRLEKYVISLICLLTMLRLMWFQIKY